MKTWSIMAKTQARLQIFEMGYLWKTADVTRRDHKWICKDKDILVSKAHFKGKVLNGDNEGKAKVHLYSA